MNADSIALIGFFGFLTVCVICFTLIGIFGK